ncbi:MAG: PilZ domain-containing protein [Thermodesulfobacteriota bacterium]
MLRLRAWPLPREGVEHPVQIDCCKVCAMDQTEDQSGQGMERREAFRVEDVLPMVCTRLPPDVPLPRSRILPGFSEDYSPGSAFVEPPDESVNPHLWRMIVQIHERLGLILQKLNLEAEGLTKARPENVSLSTGGVKFTTGERLESGDPVGVRLLLPLEPSMWIVVYGRVTRIENLGDGRSAAAVQFSEMDEAVQDAINRYTLKRQREIIRKRKGL